MPLPGRAWFHVMWGTYGTWLPGDQRGFRNSFHRIHSSGDYRNPPPRGEHSGLLRYNKDRLKGEVVLRAASERRAACDSIAGPASSLGLRLTAVAVARTHAHIAIELPLDRAERISAIGRLKIASSKHIAGKVDGRGWARGAKLVLIKSKEQRDAGTSYVKRHQKERAAVWST